MSCVVKDHSLPTLDPDHYLTYLDAPKTPRTLGTGLNQDECRVVVPARGLRSIQ